MNQNNSGNNNQASKPSIQEILRRSGVSEFPSSFRNQLAPRKFSGEIRMGESLTIEEAKNGEHEKNQKLRIQISHERRILAEERLLVDRKSGELKQEIQMIQVEMQKAVGAVKQFEEEIKIVSTKAVVSPNIYDRFFLIGILAFIKSFTQNIRNTQSWIATQNKRSSKRQANGLKSRQEQGTLLNNEDFVVRSVG